MAFSSLKQGLFEIIPAEKRHFSDYDWLKTYWLFSFSDYHDPSNVRFHSLRVFNDDYIEPGGGFPDHEHGEMEIVTLVLEGEITHRDSMGNSTTVKAGEVQRMSAGTGVVHSEFNRGDQRLHSYQIWIYPRERGLKPSYDRQHYTPALWKNRLFPVASGENFPGTVSMHADATIYRAHLDAGKTIHYACSKSRGVFVYLTSGKLSINGNTLNQNDQARIEPGMKLEIAAMDDAEFVFIDVAA